MSEEKEFKKLQDENEVLRKKIDELIGINSPIYSPFWSLINELVENELQQEEFCGQ